MSSKEKKTEDGPRPAAGEQGARGPRAPESAPDAEERPPAAKYEFKIVPADPKNALNFEDVADK